MYCNLQRAWKNIRRIILGGIRMKSLFKKRIVDERMELQSLRNAKKSWNFLLLGLGICMLVEFYVFKWNFIYITPQWVLLLAAAIYNMVLDIRDGNIYTVENSNRKHVFLLYTAAAFITSLFIGYGFHSLHDRPIVISIIMGVFSFFLIWGLMYLLDSALFRFGKKSLEKKEVGSETTDD